MFKNILLLLSIILIFVILVSTSYLLKDGNDCCGLEICQKVFKSCQEEKIAESDESVLKSEDQVDFYLKNVKSGDKLESGFTIKGSVIGSWYFEGQFRVNVYDKEGMLMETFLAHSTSDWTTGEIVPFEVTLNYFLDEDTDVVLQFEKSNASGLAENDDKVSLNIKLLTNKQLIVKVFFPSTKLSDMSDCTLVFPVTRTIAYTPAVGRASLELLLEGPLQTEKEEKYFTNISEGVVIQSLDIENGVAKVDFNQALQYQVGGSCRVESIRAQITQTLKQFPTVTDVVISIDGVTDYILQP